MKIYTLVIANRVEVSALVVLKIMKYHTTAPKREPAYKFKNSLK